MIRAILGEPLLAIGVWRKTLTSRNESTWRLSSVPLSITPTFLMSQIWWKTHFDCFQPVIKDNIVFVSEPLVYICKKKKNVYFWSARGEVGTYPPYGNSRCTVILTWQHCKPETITIPKQNKITNRNRKSFPFRQAQNGGKIICRDLLRKLEFKYPSVKKIHKEPLGDSSK